MKMFVRGLEFQFEHKFSVEEVKWWLEELAKCMTQGHHVFIFGQ